MELKQTKKVEEFIPESGCVYKQAVLKYKTTVVIGMVCIPEYPAHLMPSPPNGWGKPEQCICLKLLRWGQSEFLSTRIALYPKSQGVPIHPVFASRVPRPPDVCQDSCLLNKKTNKQKTDCH